MVYYVKTPNAVALWVEVKLNVSSGAIDGAIGDGGIQCHAISCLHVNTLCQGLVFYALFVGK